MKIKVTIIDERNGEVLENLGEVLTDNPNRALAMYASELEKWEETGAWAELHYEAI